MTDETTDTGELEAFDDVTKVTSNGPPDELARDVANFAVTMSTMGSLAAETSRSLRCATGAEREDILRRLIAIVRDGAEGAHDARRCFEETLRGMRK